MHTKYDRFDENDTKLHERLIIMRMYKKIYFMVIKFQLIKSTFVNEISSYIYDPKTYIIIKNTVQMKQCNYDKCKRRDLKKFKICKRCKSVFYCNRKHQKKDWNNKHRKNCVEKKVRDYNFAII